MWKQIFQKAQTALINYIGRGVKLYISQLGEKCKGGKSMKKVLLHIMAEGEQKGRCVTQLTG